MNEKKTSDAKGPTAKTSTARVRKCPVCKTAMPNDAVTQSFCSDRCKLIDLQKWFDGDYAIPGLPATEEDDEQFH